MLRKRNVFKAKGKVEDVALGRELVGIAGFSAQVFTEKGELVYEIDEKEETESVSFKGDFFFLTWSGRVLTRNKTLSLGEAYNRGLKVLDNTLIACGKKCGEFDLSGNALWDAYIGWTDSSPEAFEDYIYVADHTWNSLLIIRKGKVVNKIKYGEGAWSVV